MKAWGWKVLLVLLCIVASVSFARAQSDEDATALFGRAVKAYHGAQYAQAMLLNEELLSKGYVSAAVYYNLGNAYFKSGRLGRALVNYLRAMRLDPRDSDLRANLAFARAQVENYHPWPRRSVFALPQKFCSERTLRWIAFISFVVTATFFLAALYAGLRRKRVVLVTGLLGLVTLYLAGVVVVQSFDRAGRAVFIEKAEARFEPNVQATVYFKAPEGTEVRILREKDKWSKIERSDGKAGWVPARSVERI